MSRLMLSTMPIRSAAATMPRNAGHAAEHADREDAAGYSRARVDGSTGGVMIRNDAGERAGLDRYAKRESV